MKISKSDSNYLKGIAIGLMFFHHLFAFPDRIIDTNIVYVFNGFDLERYIGILGKICIPMFLFLSGYGFSVSGCKEPRYYINKFFNFYKSYWAVFFIFVPIGLFFFSDNIMYQFDPISFLYNLIGISNSYNGEWWFVELYLLLILFMPIINCLRYKPIKLLISSFLFFIIYIVLRMNHFDTPVVSVSNLLLWQPIFIVGYVIGTYKENNFVKHVLNIIYQNKKIAILIALFIVPVAIMKLKTIGLILITPLFIFFCMEAKHYIGNTGQLIISKIGSYSMFMWLTHSFYCYYFAHNYIYFPRYSILIFINLILVTYLTSMFLNKIVVIINQFLTNSSITNRKNNYKNTSL